MRFLYLLVFLLSCSPSFGQYEDMLHKPYVERLEGLRKVHRKAYAIGDSVATVAFLSEFRNWAEENNDPVLALEADVILGYYYRGNFRKSPQTIEFLLNLAEKARAEELLYIEERTVAAICLYYWQNKDYEKAFKWLMRSAQNLEKIDPETFPPMANILNGIGKSYYFFRDYRTALVYFERCARLKRTAHNNPYIADARNTLGLCYQKLGDFEASSQQFLSIIEDTSKFNNHVWRGIAMGNLGYNYYLQGEYNKAIPLLKKDIEYALAEKTDYGLAAGSTIPLADIYLKRDQMEASRRELDAARAYILASGQTKRFRKLYPVMSQWFAQNNQPDSSAVYFDSTIAATKRYEETFNSLKILRANQEFNARERELEVARLNTESQLKMKQRNLIIVLVVVALLGSVLVFWFRQKLLLKKQRISELVHQNTREALVSTEAKLENLRLKVQKDSKHIEVLEKEKTSPENQELLAELRKKNILTQEDWTEYRDLFTQIYPDFISSLKTNYPALTLAERRCLCLHKLHLTNSEMALLLGVSTNTLMVTNHRIRKKLNLENQKMLLELVHNR